MHILHQGKRLPVWDNWLQAAGLLDRIDPARGMEFSTLDQVINAVKAAQASPSSINR
ncbi:hypothetical protein [Aliamphritea spongicola]|nr:hypothetical protein [Aliamphritea spongicola]